MGNIICATRGGEGSRAAQFAAIERAKSSQQSLIFLYVTDPGSLNDFDEQLETAVANELTWMGKTLLRIAEQRARAAGIEAQVVIRMGNVQEEIAAFMRESDAQLLMLGAPRGTTANVFGDDAVEQFAASLQQSTNIPVEVVRPEDRA